MRPSTLLRTLLLAVGAVALSGCTVLTVAGAAVGLAATGAGLAVDAAVGTAKIAGKAAGAVAGAVLPGNDEGKK